MAVVGEVTGEAKLYADWTPPLTAARVEPRLADVNVRAKGSSEIDWLCRF